MGWHKLEVRQRARAVVGRATAPACTERSRRTGKTIVTIVDPDASGERVRGRLRAEGGRARRRERRRRAAEERPRAHPRRGAAATGELTLDRAREARDEALIVVAADNPVAWPAQARSLLAKVGRTGRMGRSRRRRGVGEDRGAGAGAVGDRAGEGARVPRRAPLGERAADARPAVGPSPRLRRRRRRRGRRKRAGGSAWGADADRRHGRDGSSVARSRARRPRVDTRSSRSTERSRRADAPGAAGRRWTNGSRGTTASTRVIHAAALRHRHGVAGDEYLRVNRELTERVLARAERASAHLVHVSSISVYGWPPPQRLPIDETFPFAPIGPYGASKVATEELVMRGARPLDDRAAVDHLRPRRHERDDRQDDADDRDVTRSSSRVSGGRASSSSTSTTSPGSRSMRRKRPRGERFICTYRDPIRVGDLVRRIARTVHGRILPFGPLRRSSVWRPGVSKRSKRSASFPAGSPRSRGKSWRRFGRPSVSDRQDARAPRHRAAR